MEQRRQPRTDVAIQVRVSFPGGAAGDGFARNVNHHGIYVGLVDTLKPAPGTEALLRFQIWTGRETICRLLKARVIRSGRRGVALEFTERDLVSRAVVADLLFYKGCERRRTPRTRPPAVRAVPAA